MTVTKKVNIPEHTYQINGVNIEKVQSFKYPRVQLTAYLSWKLNIEIILRNANQPPGCLQRNLFLSDKNTKLLAYTTLVRSSLEYASVIWTPNQGYLINYLESLQS